MSRLTTTGVVKYRDGDPTGHTIDISVSCGRYVLEAMPNDGHWQDGEVLEIEIRSSIFSE